jgi:hypothetical protein
MITTDLITYNRSARNYNIIHPETGKIVESFPAGHKHEAFLYTVSLFEPELFQAAQQVIDRHPQLERRTWKAVTKIIDGAVEIIPAPTDGVYATVASSDGMGRYNITNIDGYWACDCIDFTGFSAPMTDTGSRFCTHRIAYHLYLKTKADRF